MAISQHPSAELRSDYGRGATSPGEALAVEAHLQLCEQCRRETGWIEETSSDDRDRAPLAERIIAASDLPAVLRSVRAGHWRRVDRGVWRSPLRGVSGLGESVHLLKAAAGVQLMLPAQAHLLLVLRGSVQAAAGRHSPGDFVEAAGDRLTGANADSDLGCLCLVVGDDELYRRPFAGLLPRLGC